MPEPIKLRVVSSSDPVTVQSASGSLAVEAVSPHVSFERVSGGTQMSVTDVDGTQKVVIPDGAPGQDGEPGQDGAPGQDGFSPSASVSKSGGTATITITDKDGTTTASVTDVTVDSALSGSSTNPVQNKVVKAALDGKQGTLVFDNTPTQYSSNPVTSHGIYSKIKLVADEVSSNSSAIVGLQYEIVNTVVKKVDVDSSLDDDSINPVQNKVIKSALDGKQGTLTFDSAPTEGSNNPVKSGGIKSAIDAVAGAIPTNVSDLYDDSGHYTKPSGGIPASDLASGVIPDISGKQDTLTFDTAPTANSTNPVTSGGVYTALQAKADPVTVDTVSGTTPAITGVANHRYIAGECSTLSITVPASGIIDVVFESGSTPTVLTVTPPSGKTMKWPGWFDPTSLEANATYEINIMDGNLGTVMVWT